MRKPSHAIIESNRARRVLSCLCLAAALSHSACASSDTGRSSSPPQCFHNNAELERSIGFCQAVRVGDVLYVSGSVGAGDMPAAIRQVYDELRATLAAQGLDFANIVKENVFTTDLDAFVAAKDVRSAYYGEHLPAASWIGVDRLFLAEYVLEVEVVAHYPQ